MYAKLLTLVSLVLAPTSMIVMISDSLIVQAETGCPNGWDQLVCNFFSNKGVRLGSIRPPEFIAKLEHKINQRQAKADDYILVGYLYSKVGNTSMSETRLTQGLNLAKKDRNLEGQAIALKGLGEVLAVTGRRQEATSRLTEARNVYRLLGDQSSVRELDQQLIMLPNQRILKNP